jgi:hypothetical protein
MWVFIDARLPGVFRIGCLVEGGKHRVETIEARSHEILPAVVRRIGRKRLEACDGVCVVEGPGSFTTVRTGVLLGNLLARLFQKSLVGVSSLDAEDVDRLFEMLSHKRLGATRLVLPVYDAEPNITLPTVSA